MGFKPRTFSVHLSALPTELSAFQTHEMLIKRFLPFRVVGANALNGVWTLLKVFDPGRWLASLDEILHSADCWDAQRGLFSTWVPWARFGLARPGPARPEPTLPPLNPKMNFFSHRDNFELRIFSSQADNYFFEKWSLEALDAIIAQPIKSR